MIDKARSRGLPRPVFSSSITSFTVTMGRSELLGPNVRRWLDGLEVALPTPVHEIALAMMRGGGYTTNAALREWGADRIAASQVLRDLVEWGLAIRHGGRRYARYSLDPALLPKHSLAQVSVQTDEGNLRPSVTVALQAAGESSAASIQAATGLGRAAVVNYLNALIAAGEVEALGPTRSPKRRYRWIGTAPPSD